MPPGGKFNLRRDATVLDQQVVPADWLGRAVIVVGRKAATGYIVLLGCRGKFLPGSALVADRC
eukprot:233093-Alexandrium_andersonii.AAC.1